MNSHLFLRAVIVAFLLSTAGAGFAQNADAPKAGTTTSGASPSRGGANAQNGIIKRDGVIYLMKDGTAQRVVQDMQLSEGIHVTPRGDVKLADGKQLKLNEGQMVTLQGQMTNAPAGFAEQTGVGTGTTSSAVESGAGAVSGGTRNGSRIEKQGSAAGATTKSTTGTGPAGTGANAGQ